MTAPDARPVDLVALVESITTGIDDQTRRPAPPRRWLYLDTVSRTFLPVGPGDSSIGWRPPTGPPAASDLAGLSDDQLRAAGIDPADVVDVVTMTTGDRTVVFDSDGVMPTGLPSMLAGPFAGPAAARAEFDARIGAADAELWRSDPPSVIDELVGRGPTPHAPHAGLIRDLAQPWRTVPAYLRPPPSPVDGPPLVIDRGAAVNDPTALEVDARVMMTD